MQKATIKNKVTRKKKRGFTLTELIAVMAIIAILSAVLAPKVLGYISEGKKTAAAEEARQIVLAVDSFNIKATSLIKDTDKYNSFSTELEGKGYIDTKEFKAIGSTNTYAELRGIVKGTNSFTLGSDGSIGTIVAVTGK